MKSTQKSAKPANDPDGYYRPFYRQVAWHEIGPTEDDSVDQLLTAAILLSGEAILTMEEIDRLLGSICPDAAPLLANAAA